MDRENLAILELIEYMIQNSESSPFIHSCHDTRTGIREFTIYGVYQEYRVEIVSRDTSVQSRINIRTHDRPDIIIRECDIGQSRFRNFFKAFDYHLRREYP